LWRQAYPPQVKPHRACGSRKGLERNSPALMKNAEYQAEFFRARPQCAAKTHRSRFARSASKAKAVSNMPASPA
jgi:hypothetical protein